MARTGWDAWQCRNVPRCSTSALKKAEADYKRKEKEKRVKDNKENSVAAGVKKKEKVSPSCF